MTHSLQRLGNTLPLGSLDAYVGRVNQIPLLSAEREHELACRLYENEDMDAARELIMAHLRYVVRVARGYDGYGLAQADLIQEGNVGLMKAVRRFNPHLGVRLVSFAVHWIKAEMHEFILKNWRIVKIATTKAQRKLFFNLRKMKQRLGWFTQEEIAAVANDLKVSTADVLEMEKRLNAHDAAFDGYTDEDGGDDGSTVSLAPAQVIADHRFSPDRLLENLRDGQRHQTQLEDALEQLDPRSRSIMQRRWLNDNKATLQELAQEYNVSAERVRQLETKALKKLRCALQDADADIA